MEDQTHKVLARMAAKLCVETKSPDLYPALIDIGQNLDTQYTIGLAQGVPVTFISAGQLNSTDIVNIFLDMANYLTAMENPPQVLTSSYAFNESLFDVPTANKLCNAYMQLGARGVSVVSHHSNHAWSLLTNRKVVWLWRWGGGGGIQPILHS